MSGIDIFESFEMIEEYMRKVVLYIGEETVNDPYEKTKTVTLWNPITIKGLIKEIGFSGLKYKYYGSLSTGSKELICNKKYLNLLKVTRKILIDGEEYGIYKDADKNFQLLKRNDYLIVILERK